MSHPLVRLLLDRRLWTGPGPWVVALLIAVNVWVADRRATLAEERKANLTSGDTEAGSAPALRFDPTFGENILPALAHIPDAIRTRLTVVSGMSQMYTINDRRPGDRIICEHLDDALATAGGRAFGLAAPNLCNEEALFLLLTLFDRKETTPAVFLYGSCFDKFRNIDLRPGFLSVAKRLPSVLNRWDRVAVEYADRYPLATTKMLDTAKAVRAEPSATELTFEDRLRDAASVVPLVGARKDLNVAAQLALYDVRNRVFRIKPTSKRPVIPSRYAANQEFFGLMTDLAAAHGVQFVTYVIPLNPNAENPYVAAEYEEFKRWLTAECDRRHVPFANLEGIVPFDDWGEFNGGPDFKHFRGAGHRVTAERLLAEFGPILRGRPPGPRP